MATGNPGPVIPERYRQALGDSDPLEAMAEAPERLRKLVRGLTEAQLATRPAPGKWSIKEIVAHLADGEVILGSRYRLIAAHDQPPIAGYDQDAFVEKLGVANARTSELLDDFTLARAINIGLLVRLPEDALERVGIHAERGAESIRTLVYLYAGHDIHHLQQVETIRTGLFPSGGGRRKKPTSAAKKKAAPVAKKAAPARGKAAPVSRKVPRKR
jgi:hypothetical protein